MLVDLHLCSALISYTLTTSDRSLTKNHVQTIPWKLGKNRK